MITRFAAALTLLCMSSTALADTWIDNVNGISVNRDGSVDRFAGLVIDEDGRISEILDFGDRPTREIEYRVDGDGRVMVPGFIDGHAHLMDLGLGTLVLDLSGTQSLEEALSRIAAYAAANPDRPWIIGRGWNQERWGLDRFPTAAELDAVVSDRPVWLERADNHAHWGNSLALAAGNVTAQTRNPAGGRIERLANGAPAGVLIDNATDLVTSQVPPPLPEDRDLALYNAQQLLLSFGITAMADMGTTVEDWMTIRRAGDAGWLQIRIMAYADSLAEMLLIGGPGPTQWLYEDRLRLNGLKVKLDGALGSRGALLKQPYADDPGNQGLPLTSGTQLRNLMSRAALDNFQIAVHAIGDAANADLLQAIDELAKDYTGDRRWRVEHAQIVDTSDMAMFGQHGIIASMQPVHQTSDMFMAEARLGADRLDGAYAWRTILDQGGTLAFGTDAPVEPVDPLSGIAAAVSRTNAEGEPFGGWLPEQTISREQALAAYTANAAYAGFADGRFGRLAPGERADFVFLSADPLLASPEQIRGVQVMETWIAGQRVYDADVQNPLIEGPHGAEAAGR
ncbi:amidohydrolase [Aurantiacibacter marinus]|uniref:Metal-dependent hydrolase n=1 Tax=Aurantiacibacter marinus TaxID=874156 RepID=A0A0H0XPF1_9SPHN|nr:amidohydrolase [Aurantiacibacter marinus]KLI64239.1 metal-dependent hydrolase [Aurantiacibacter marinus]